MASGKENLSKVSTYLTHAALVLNLAYRILFYNTWLVRNDADRGADDLLHVSNFLDCGDVG